MPVEFLQSIHLEQNGSGKVFRQVFFRPIVTNVVKWFERKAGVESSNFPVDEKKLRNAAHRMGNGVSFVTAQPQKNDKGWDGYAAIYSFEDINQLQIGHGEETKGCDNESIGFSYLDGLLEIRIPYGNPSTEALEPYTVGSRAKMPQWLFSLFDGFRIATAVIAEDGIAETNATYVSGNSIVLLDISISPFLQSADFFGILEKFRYAKDLGDLKSIIGDLTGIKIETQPVIRVKLN